MMNNPCPLYEDKMLNRSSDKYENKMDNYCHVVKLCFSSTQSTRTMILILLLLRDSNLYFHLQIELSLRLEKMMDWKRNMITCELSFTIDLVFHLG